MPTRDVWSTSELQTLLDYVNQNKVNFRINWLNITTVLPNFTKQQCQYKFKSYHQTSLRQKIVNNSDGQKTPKSTQKSFSFSSILIFDESDESPIEQSDIGSPQTLMM